MDRKIKFNISTLRKKRNLTQKQLAENLGVKKMTISLWENGGRTPSSTMIVKLYEFFQLNSVDDLIKIVPYL